MQVPATIEGIRLCCCGIMIHAETISDRYPLLSPQIRQNLDWVLVFALSSTLQPLSPVLTFLFVLWLKMKFLLIHFFFFFSVNRSF